MKKFVVNVFLLFLIIILAIAFVHLKNIIMFSNGIRNCDFKSCAYYLEKGANADIFISDNSSEIIKKIDKEEHFSYFLYFDSRWDKKISMPALSWAVIKNEEELVRLLLRYGAQPDWGGKLSPYRLSVFTGNENLCNMFIDYGANPNEYRDMTEPPLRTAIKWNKNKIFDLLIDRGADIYKHKEGDASWLRIAYFERKFIFFKKLITKGCLLDDGFTPEHTILTLSAYDDRYEYAEFLLKNNANVDEKKEGGFTALYYAVLNRNLKLCDLLLKHGANPLEKAENGATILEYANTKCPPEFYEKMQNYVNAEQVKGR